MAEDDSNRNQLGKWWNIRGNRYRNPSISGSSLIPQHTLASENLEDYVVDESYLNGRFMFYGRDSGENAVEMAKNISKRCHLTQGDDTVVTHFDASNTTTDFKGIVNGCKTEETTGTLHLETQSVNDVIIPYQNHTFDNMTVVREISELTPALRYEHCHTRLPETRESKAARNKLIISCCLSLIFMIAECVGGFLSNSLAIMSDAVHLISDFTTFVISLIAVYMATKPSTVKMSFGYYRAEILGAVISVVLIWILTGILTYTAVVRIVHDDFNIEADTMLIVASVGIVINITMMIVLHGFCSKHGHSHGLHSHETGHGHGHGHSHGSQLEAGHGHSHSDGPDHSGPDDSHHNSSENINVRAAFIHVIGDCIQSVGVLTAALIIKFQPSYKIADPICTFLFSILVIFTTVHIVRDIYNVLMEGVPSGVNYQLLKKNLEAIEGVKMAHSLHVWSLTLNRIAFTVHLAVDPNCDFQSILEKAEAMLQTNQRFHHVTVQVEYYVPDVMDSCQECKVPLEA